MSRVSCTVLMGNIKNACISVGNPKQNKSLERPRRGWQINIEMRRESKDTWITSLKMKQ
jgi:hypothetical protein